MAADDIWYFARNGERGGPVSELDLINSIARGDLRGHDFVWKEGMTQWVPAASVAELFPYGVPTASQPVPQATLPYSGGMPLQNRGALDYYSPIGVMMYGGFWRRFIAYVLDSVLILAPFLILQFAIDAASGAATAVTTGPGGAVTTTTATSFTIVTGCGMGMIQFLAFWLYFALQESSSYQATLGKRLLGLYVTDQAGGRITFGQATGRYFGKIVSGLILYFGFIMAAFTERKQGLHDMMAGTLVLQRAKS